MVCIIWSRGCRALALYEAIFLFNNTIHTHTHSLEQVTVYRSEFNPDRSHRERQLQALKIKTIFVLKSCHHCTLEKQREM